MSEELLNIIIADGSRHFGELPQSASWYKLRRHIRRLNGVTETNILTDHVTEAWINFSFQGYPFSINNQFGDYWFFVNDRNCPDETLRIVLLHCRGLLGNEE